MGVAPFTAAFLDHRCTTTDQIGLRLGDVPGPRPVQVHLLPSAAAYVGADIVAGVVASGLGYDAGTTLLIDVGTNGEMVLSHGGDLIGCATAAGPAFEGGTLADGVRAGDGAISRLRVKTDPLSFEVQTIGSGKPIGVCGSAYIDFLAESRRAGVLNAAGRLVPDLESDLVIRDDYGRSVRVAYGQGKRPIMIREADVAALMQAKAAIAAGALTLLERYQLRPADIDRVCLAGGFGRYVDVANAIDCGLLPGFTAGQVQAMGNLSLAGAYMALLDRAMLDEHKRTARAISVIELNQEPGFEDCYIEQLML